MRNEMSFFCAKLNELMNARGIKPAELGRRTGIDDSKLSRWLNDKTQFVAMDDLAALCRAVGKTKKEQAELIRAHLLDECPGDAEGSELVEIKITGARKDYLSDTTAPPLMPKYERAFEILRQYIRDDSDLQTIILGLANVFDRNEKQPGDHK